MKTICIALFTFLTMAPLLEQDKLTINAVFNGLEENIYSFTDGDKTIYEFQNINSEAIKKYDLNDEKFIGKHFAVTYTLEVELDDLDEEYEVFTIIDLELID